jgi:hypothetical protein
MNVSERTKRTGGWERARMGGLGRGIGREVGGGNPYQQDGQECHQDQRSAHLWLREGMAEVVLHRQACIISKKKKKIKKEENKRRKCPAYSIIILLLFMIINKTRIRK